jgi:S-DNA-T family DNA segregation ATPase FtsK/SpoIIIE
MTEAKVAKQGKKLEEFLIALCKLGWAILRVSWHGLSRTVLCQFERFMMLICFYGIIFILVYWNWKHLLILNWCFPNVFPIRVIMAISAHVPMFMQFLVISGFFTILLGVALGFVHFIRIARCQNALRYIGLKSAVGSEPKVIDVEETDEFKRKITIASQGVGIEHYRSKKSDLESAFGAIVEDIRIAQKSRKLVEIYLADKELPSFVAYEDCASALTEPNSFVVGESLKGTIIQSIRSLPHLLIAGTSGNGKSVFFNQILISMLKTSPRIQLFLLDLKLGVEVKAYADLPNVRIAKDASEAVTLLKAVVEEMKKRFQILEQKGTKQIDPERDGKDLILVGVDEASVLYGKRRGDKTGNDLINLARDLTDEIAKLGRAACIHLIVATQKVTNESIDTKIQENVGGRVCFRVNTLQGSNTVLGNKKAYELPETKGRAIWASGNEFTEVQTPFVSDSLIKNELELIKLGFAEGKRKCLQGLLGTQETVQREKEVVQFFPEREV